MRQENGFTLLELMVVVLIIGILAAIAIPKFGGTKDKAYVASMRSDLRNLITIEETYFTGGSGYSANFTDLNFNPSAGVTVVVGQADTSGWNATAKHSASSKTCGVFIGNATPPVSGAQAGETICN